MASNATPTRIRMLVKDIRAHPGLKTVFWNLAADHMGTVISEARKKGDKTKIAFRVYGTGPRKLLFVSGLGGIMPTWQRQIYDFGISHPTVYSVLVVDNRGLGLSDHPTEWYTTKIMAGDLVAVVDSLGWTKDRQLNLVGCSMGGMICQEVASVIPHRIRTLTLLSTAAKVEAAEGFSNNKTSRILGLLWPGYKEDERLELSIQCSYTKAWLEAPDSSDERVTDETRFNTNWDRIAASDLAKREAVNGSYSRVGYASQMYAAKSHLKTAEELETIAGIIGRDRIMVVHGSEDKMLTFDHGLRVAEYLGLISRQDPALDWSAVGPSGHGDSGPDSEWTGKPWSNWKIETSPDTALPYNVHFVYGQAHTMQIECRKQLTEWLTQLIDSAYSLTD